MLKDLPEFLLLLLGFTFLAMASQKVGSWFKRLHLPSITGMLLTGILIGPYAINFLDHYRLEQLDFLNEVALAFIAFAAGTELYLKEIRSRISNIAWQSGFLVLAIFSISSVAFYLLGEYIPFMQDMSHTTKLAVALLGGTIFVARSPSSAIAIKRELRAKGPFVKTAIGVTVIVDFLVIILFAITFSASLNLTQGKPFNWLFVLDIFFELQLALFLGYVVSRLLVLLYGRNIHQHIKLAVLLLLGFGVYIVSHYLQELSGQHLPFEIHAEPLLICIIASFIVTNYTPHRLELQDGIHKLGPYVYLVFFTLTGAHLALDVFARVWQLALALFAIRIVAIMIGTYMGTTVSREEPKFRRYSWMSFITQAGVGIGLATVVAQEFPGWGDSFYTMVLSVIVLNEIAGPMLFKLAIRRMGESHEKSRVHEGDGIRDAIIFGMEPQSISLAKQLKEHKWEAKIVDCRNLSAKDQILDI
jgi:Kef-type K+ transport system membrane component KefB